MRAKICFCLWCYQLFFKLNLIKERSEKKNAEHTRMHTISRNFLTQYSRRLLSILAQQTRTNKKTNNTRFVMRTVVISFFVCFNVKTAQTCGAQKKMRSTHACTPSFAPFLLNIHVGCCLFSHISNQPKIKTNLVVLCIANLQHYFLSWMSYTNCTVVQTTKKMRSTHTCTPSFCNFLAQYSRRLLSILAQPVKYTKK